MAAAVITPSGAPPMPNKISIPEFGIQVAMPEAMSCRRVLELARTANPDIIAAAVA